MQPLRQIYKAIEAAAATNKNKNKKKKKKKKTEKSTLASITEPPLNHPIPTDVMTDILSFLPVKSLLRFRCLSKEWRDLIEDRRFVDMHKDRGGSRVIKPRFGAASNFDTDKGEDTFRVLFEDDHGLLLLKKKVNKSYHIRNPATRQILDLPSPSFKSFLMFMFQDQYTGLYKVFSFNYHYRENIRSEVCEILTAGIDDRWRPLEASEHLQDFGVTAERFLLIRTYGAIHMVKIREQKLIKAVSINLKNERAAVVNTLPQGFFSDSDKLSPFNWEGKLAFFTIVNMELHVLVLEDYMKQRFGERKIVIPLTFMDEEELQSALNTKPQNEDEHQMIVNIRLELAKDGIVIFRLNNGDTIAYDYIESRIIRSLDMDLRYEGMYIGECLTSFNGMRAEKQQQKQENSKKPKRRRKQKRQKSSLKHHLPLFNMLSYFWL
ncbi:F-box protein [Melia azedarach]|uniref:F-box protein n=1 Tax=Melia azedarach TaxID=155640 RepID=A0ACC1WYZ3_MELAZ|nr:F-box protein [Melia azedarach]